MSDLTRCPHCRAIVYIDDRYCPDCSLEMWGYKADDQTGNEHEQD